MKNKAKLLTDLMLPHSSEKTSCLLKNNVVVLKSSKKITKYKIKKIFELFFKMKILTIKTLIVKGKMKRYKKNIGYNKNWKKIYITLKSGQNLELFSSSE